MKFWTAFSIFWIIFLLFFAIGLPLILHYAGDHHLSDFEMTNTSASEAFVLLGLGTALWLIVFIYYIKEFLIIPLLKKKGLDQLLERGEQRKERVTKTIALAVIGLLLLFALAAGLLVYSYINESHGYGWRYLYFWHPYIMIPGSFIFYLSFLFGTTNGVFSKYLGINS